MPESGPPTRVALAGAAKRFMAHAAPAPRASDVQKRADSSCSGRRREALHGARGAGARREWLPLIARMDARDIFAVPYVSC